MNYCENIAALQERLEILEKRVADLERNQLQTMDCVTNYINDTESLANKMHEELQSLPDKLQSLPDKLQSLPDTLIRVLADNGFGE